MSWLEFDGLEGATFTVDALDKLGQKLRISGLEQHQAVLVLCSDGLSNQVSAEEIGRITRGVGRPEEICEALIEEAMHTGAPDNVTVVTARLRTPDGDYRRGTNGG